MDIHRTTTTIKEESLDNEIDIEEVDLNCVKEESCSVDSLLDDNIRLGLHNIKSECDTLDTKDMTNLDCHLVCQDIEFIKCEEAPNIEWNVDVEDPLQISNVPNTITKTEPSSDINGGLRQGIAKNKESEPKDDGYQETKSIIVSNLDISDNADCEIDLGNSLNTPQKQLHKHAFKCSLCNFSAAQKGNLKRHLLTHTGYKAFKCPQCNFSSMQKSNLKRHLLTHTEDKPFKCSQCNFSAIQKRNLNHHLLTHTGDRPFKCSQCNFSTIQKSNLKRHMLTHTGAKPFKCMLCNFSTIIKSNLKRHSLIHTGDKPFKCSQCNFSTIQKLNLKHHLLSHTGDKPFKCTQCNFSTTQKSNLKRHILSHSGDKPFKCTVCNFSTTQKSSLKRHLRTHSG